MKRAICVALGTGALISSAAAISIGAAGPGDSRSMSRDQYEAAVLIVEMDRPRRLALCDTLSGPEREVCRAEATAGDLLRLAEIEAGFRRTPEAERALQRARIDARYLVERAQCGALGGAKRERCLVRAHATKGRALLHAAAPYEVRF